MADHNEGHYLDTEGFADAEESADARLLLYSTGHILECLSERYGQEIHPSEVRHRTKSAGNIITLQVGHDGCMAMEGYEVQDLLCRLGGLFGELSPAMRRIEAKNAASLCTILSNRLMGFCGRAGGGDRRSHKTQVKYATQQNAAPAHRPPSPGRMGG